MAIKKSLFNKPAWAAKTAIPAQDDRPIFEQNVYEDILEANRKKEEKKLAKIRAKEEKQSESASRKAQSDEDAQPTKRRRISVDLPNAKHHEDESDVHNSGSDSDSDSKKSTTSQHDHKSAKVSPQRRHEPVAQRVSQRTHGSRKRASEKIDENSDGRTQVSEDEDDVVVIDVVSKPRLQQQKSKVKRISQPPPPESDSDPEDDEYMKELKRAARAEARTKSLRIGQQRATPQIGSRSPSVALVGSPDAKDGVSRDHNSNFSAADIETTDPEISIRVKTIIPNCAEVFAKRRASQRFDVVFEWFIKHHQLSSFIADKVFFTWNGTRLYKSTTINSVLATIKKKYGTKVDGSDLAEGRIEIEAVTDEIYEHRLRQKERQRQLLESGGEWQPDEEGSLVKDSEPQINSASNEQHEQGDQKRASGTIIHLISDGDESLPEMHLRVHPHTTIDRIVNGYKKKMRVDAQREIYLVFDGDRLEKEQTVADVGFEEGDRVDIRSK